ncbi:Hypothetical_protein [Hexamita inflata]|uniref:Hypothetical_protein n=1 Tax=Hexamita inflata TaxID=28002 RepID=A0ABP1HX29_9EUKA
MFIFKPINGIELYYSVVNGQIELINKQEQVISNIKTKYSFNPGEEQSFPYFVHQKKVFQSEISNTDYKIPEEQFTNVHFCNGKTYFNVLDMIFVVKKDLSIQVVSQLPNYGLHYGGFQKLSHQGGNMFTMNNKLYVHNNSKKLYQVKANHKLKCIRSNHKNIFYYQFCDKVYAITMHDIYLVMNNLKFVRIKELYNIKVIMALNGIIIIKSDCIAEQDYYYVMNMQTAEIIQIQKRDQNFEALYRFRSIFSLGSLGKQLNDIIFQQIFGYDSKKLEKYYSDYIRQYGQCQRPVFAYLFNNDLNMLVNYGYEQLNILYNLKQEMKNVLKQRLEKVLFSIRSLNVEMTTKFLYVFEQSQAQ